MYVCVNKPLNEIKFRHVKPRSTKYRKWSNLLCDNSMSFDIETSNGFYRNGNVYKFDKTIGYDEQGNFDPEKASKHWEQFEKVGIMYIWQFAIDDNVFYGRTIKELQEFIYDLEEVEPLPKLIYVHNLGFEFNAVIREYFEIESLFARKERHPLTLRLAEYNIEFRCSYYLTNLSLANCVKEYKLTTAKLDTLDYLEIRTPFTKLSKSELQYCYNDVLIVNQVIDKYRDEYGTIWQIPLTQTGEVRREVQKLLSKDRKWIKRCHSLNNFTFEEYNEITQLMTGGSTHANRLWVNKLIDKSFIDKWFNGNGKITCYDFASSYPWVMLSRKYPLSKFILTEYNKKYENDDKYSYIIKIKFSQLECVCHNPYLSKHKAISLHGEKSDNGKLMHADECEYILTNIDMKIVRRNYKWQEMEIITFKYAINEYLPDDFRRYIVNMYCDKTTLKNVEGMQDLYLKKKQKINALYGMMLTKIFNDIVTFDCGEWDTNKFCQEVFDRLKAEKEEKSMYNDFLPMQCGIWVTAYARLNLWENLILPNDEFVMYYDTDSVYFADNSVLGYVNKYNDTIPQQHAEISSQLEIESSQLSPSDIDGIPHPIGMLDFDGEYIEGKFLGAKRYALRKKNGQLKQTVAGVRKAGVEALCDSLDNFNVDLVYDYDASQKSIMTYTETQRDGIVWNRGKYDEFVSHNRYANNLMPTTYGFGKAINDYLKLVDYYQNEYRKE